jgi:hypothetical protein
MSSVKKGSPHFHVGDWVKFDYGPKKVSARIVEDRGLLGIQGRRLYRVQLDKELGEASTFEVPENELETELPPVRLSYEVRYKRSGNTNVWHARTRKEQVLKGVKAKGAVGYTTSFFEGERADDQRYAAVHVYLEVDPHFDEAAFEAAPTLVRDFADRARAAADEMFLSRHPRAKVEHVQGSTDWTFVESGTQ